MTTTAGAATPMVAAPALCVLGVAALVLPALALGLVLDLQHLVAIVVATGRADVVADMQLAAARAGGHLRQLDRVGHAAHPLLRAGHSLLRYRSHRLVVSP